MIGVLGTQIILGGEWQTANVFRTSDVLRGQAGFVQHPGIEGSLAGLRDNGAEAFGLFFANVIRTPGFCDVIMFHFGVRMLEKRLKDPAAGVGIIFLSVT